jgi:hypothetical protein
MVVRTQRADPGEEHAMITHVDEATLDAMERYGGSFVQQLATAYRVADPENQAKLRDAFALVFAQYAGLAELGKDR